ncbi:hypothetical protein [Aquipuribacter nitratireducens]|uniref:Small CPxCG-related zinc finger protein n=1 Tax=Aquipuribacter nitratireducens TaxID=650104 RepID=A0ABW0GJC3_9MICO
MTPCPDCRYCSPEQEPSPRQRWPRPTQWFEQPCPSCFHRLRAHRTGVPQCEEVVGALAGEDRASA